MVGMYLPPEIVDMTARTPRAYRMRNRMSVQIDTVVLHQTSFSRGNLPDLYLSVHAHFVVLPNGDLVQLHPVEAYLVSRSMRLQQSTIDRGRDSSATFRMSVVITGGETRKAAMSCRTSRSVVAAT